MGGVVSSSVPVGLCCVLIFMLSRVVRTAIDICFFFSFAWGNICLQVFLCFGLFTVFGGLEVQW